MSKSSKLLLTLIFTGVIGDLLALAVIGRFVGTTLPVEAYASFCD
ncbi:MAG: hypothetical protein ACRERU_13290 [Methylococcales bacterium]